MAGRSGAGRSPARVRALVARGRDDLRTRFGWLTAAVGTIGQSALAAGLAWLIARLAFDHPHPYVASMAAVFVVGVTRGRHIRGAVEAVVAGALGAGSSVLLGAVIGNPALRITIVVAAAMAVAVLVADSPGFRQQAAIAAILLTSIATPTRHAAVERTLDSLVGGGVGLIMTQLLFPLHPIKLIKQAVGPVFERLSDTLDELAAALAAGDGGRADDALDRAREIDDWVRSLDQAVAAGNEVARSAPARRRMLAELGPYAEAVTQVGYLVRNTRALARAAGVLLRTGRAAPAGVVHGVRDLAGAVRALRIDLVEGSDGDGTRSAALRAATAATTALERREDVALAMVVGLIRSTSVDLLRGSGMDPERAVQVLEAAAGPVARSEEP